MERTLNVREHDKMAAIAELMRELEIGEKTGEEGGWFTIEEVEAELGINNG